MAKEEIIAALVKELDRQMADTLGYVGEASDDNTVTIDGTVDLEALAAVVMSLTEKVAWQPIDTAPKDGRRVICWNSEWIAPESGCLYGMFWAANSLAADKGGWKHQPTHWMPLPAPPTGDPGRT